MCIVLSVMTNNFHPKILRIIGPIYKQYVHIEEAYIALHTSKWKILSENQEYLYPTGATCIL